MKQKKAQQLLELRLLIIIFVTESIIVSVNDFNNGIVEGVFHGQRGVSTSDTFCFKNFRSFKLCT